jgi:hypothetical protein
VNFILTLNPKWGCDKKNSNTNMRKIIAPCKESNNTNMKKLQHHVGKTTTREEHHH